MCVRENVQKWKNDGKAKEVMLMMMKKHCSRIKVKYVRQYRGIQIIAFYMEYVKNTHKLKYFWNEKNYKKIN